MPPHHSTLSIPNTTNRLPSQERPSGHTSPGKHRRDHAAATTAERTRQKDDVTSPAQRRTPQALGGSMGLKMRHSQSSSAEPARIMLS